jgi:hypothetical protein
MAKYIHITYTYFNEESKGRQTERETRKCLKGQSYFGITPTGIKVSLSRKSTYIQYLLYTHITRRVADPDPHRFGKLDPDQHQNGKLDPDPHQSEKQDSDSDPQQGEKGRSLRESFWSTEGSKSGKSE